MDVYDYIVDVVQCSNSSFFFVSYSGANADGKNQLLALRCIANMFVHPHSLSIVDYKRPLVCFLNLFCTVLCLCLLYVWLIT